MKFIIWSRPLCSFCTKAKLIFKNNNFEYKEFSVSTGALEDGVTRGTKEELLARAPNAKTYPQIWVIKGDQEIHIGGHDDLVKWLAK